MERLRTTLVDLEHRLAEAGRTLSAANEARVRAAIASLHGVLAQLETAYDAEEKAEASEEATEALREARQLLDEAALSHDQIRSSLHTALRAAHPGNVYTYPVDVFDKHVVYRQSQDGDSSSQLMKRGYTTNADGSVSLGDDPMQVQAVTNYEPVSEALSEAALRQLLEADFSQAQRDAMAKSGEAMSGGEYPIPNVEYLKKAIKAIGRGKEPHSEIKAHIVKRAKALGAESELPESWKSGDAKESADVDLVGGLVSLQEKAVRRDGTAAIKLISPGWGTSGYYGADVLKRDGPKVFAKGLHMYLDHPTIEEESQRPERSLKDLAGVLESDARWQDNGADGAGLYADAKLRTDYAPLIEELAPHIGVSIRALGRPKAGEAEGKRGPIVESIASAKSVDFVTLPGRGGKVLQLIEAARTRTTPTHPTTRQENLHVEEELKEAKRELDTARAELARLREAAVLREARDVASARLAKADLPEITRARLVESLAKIPTLTKEGALDEAAFAKAIDDMSKAEVEYLAKVTGSGQIRGMGSSSAASDASLQEAEKTLESAFARILGAESTAKIAAKGRA